MRLIQQSRYKHLYKWVFAFWHGYMYIVYYENSTMGGGGGWMAAGEKLQNGEKISKTE